MIPGEEELSAQCQEGVLGLHGCWPAWRRYRCNRPDHMVQFADGTAIFADSKGKWSAFEHECSRQNLAKMRGQMAGAFRGARHGGPPVVGAIIVVQGGVGTAGNLVSS